MDRITTARRLVGEVLTTRDLRALDRVVERCRARLAADMTMFALMTDRHTVISASGSFGGVPQRGTHTPFEDTLCFVTLLNDTPVVIADAHADPRVSSVPAVRDGGVGSYLGTPVRVGEQTVGVLCAVGSQPRQWTQAESDVMTEAAAELGGDLAAMEADPSA